MNYILESFYNQHRKVTQTTVEFEMNALLGIFADRFAFGLKFYVDPGSKCD